MTKEQLIEELETIRKGVIKEKIPYKKEVAKQMYCSISVFVEMLLEKYYNYKYNSFLYFNDEELNKILKGE